MTTRWYKPKSNEERDKILRDISIQPTSSLRQGLYPFFSILLLFVGVGWMEWFGFFEAFIIIIGAGIILKLTDIEEAIQNLK